MLGYTSIHISSSEIRHITLHLFGFYAGKTDYFWDSAQAFEFNLSHSVLQQSYFIKKLLNNRVCLFSSNKVTHTLSKILIFHTLSSSTPVIYAYLEATKYD